MLPNKSVSSLLLSLLCSFVFLSACEKKTEPKIVPRVVVAKVLKVTPGGCVASPWSLNYTSESFQRRSDRHINGEIQPSQINTDLMVAVVRNQPDRVNSLLNAGADVEGSNERGCTALIWASALGREEIVESLINAGADVSKPDSAGTTPIMIASSAGSSEIVRLLLTNGADVNSKQTGGSNEIGRTALHHAIYRQNNIDVINLLVESGIKIDVTSEHGQTALMNAAQSAKLENVKRLVELGADIHLQSNRGLTALKYAKSVNPRVSVKDALVEYLESRD